MLQSIAPLVSALGNQNSSVQPFLRGSISNNDLHIALGNQRPGTILVAYQGLVPYRLRNVPRYSHRVSLFLRAPVSQANGGYEDLIPLIVNGVPSAQPSGQALTLEHVRIDPGCFPPDMDLFSFERVILPMQDATLIEYYEGKVTLVEDV